uniref:Uncharacterized protein n=1 Tax=Octopus bimaculoides TaxID=37653 RepID=A0A0L8HVE5_OCTBM
MLLHNQQHQCRFEMSINIDKLGLTQELKYEGGYIRLNRSKYLTDTYFTDISNKG